MRRGTRRTTTKSSVGIEASTAQAGFSLVELMVVVAIIGILAALAVPRLRVFQAKARQAEARNNLSLIYTLEESYFGDNDTYATFGENGASVTIGPGTCSVDNPLGFKLTNCDQARYTYNVELTTANDVAGFTATATSGSGAQNRVLSGCQADVWQINQDKQLTAQVDVTRNCGSGGDGN